tara:strand:- start:494 stop:661 length:168 start_codon:yes stop_codon:yes gene_type:complete
LITKLDDKFLKAFELNYSLKTVDRFVAIVSHDCIILIMVFDIVGCFYGFFDEILI